MNLQSKLAARVAAGKPVRVGLVGAGKFGSMFLSQVLHIPGLEVAVISEVGQAGLPQCRLGRGTHRTHKVFGSRPRRLSG